MGGISTFERVSDKVPRRLYLALRITVNTNVRVGSSASRMPDMRFTRRGFNQCRGMDYLLLRQPPWQQELSNERRRPRRLRANFRAQ